MVMIEIEYGISSKEPWNNEKILRHSVFLVRYSAVIQHTECFRLTQLLVPKLRCVNAFQKGKQMADQQILEIFSDYI